jgi:membrane-associated protein
MFEHIMRSIGDTVGLWLYVIAGGLAFAEAAILVGMVLPGETALLVAGVFCNAKYGDLQLGIMIPVAVVCAIGPALRRSRLGAWVGERRWAAVDAFIHRHGGKAVLLGRLTALMRALMPSMAGMSGMRYRTFLLWNALGGIFWAPGCVLLGYAFASALDVVGETLTWAPLVILAIIIVIMVVLHIRKERKEEVEGEVYAQADAASEL